MTAKEGLYPADATDTPGYYAKAANGNVIPSRATKRKDIHAEVRDTGEDREIRITVTHRKHGLYYVGWSMAVCLVLLMFWQYIVLPAWTHYQEQLACGSSHVCMATVTVSPGKVRTFISLVYNARVMVYEMPDANNADAHSYPVAVIYTGVDWHTVTPRMQVIDVNKDGYQDIVITSPDFQGADPVLYSQENGTFSWQEPERKG